MPRLEFTAGEVLEASEMNIISDQTIMVFATTAARDSGIPSPSEGMHVYISDINQLQYWDGAAWQLAGGAGVGFEASLLLGGM